MSIKCPDCGTEYDVTLFEYGKSVDCICGCRFSLREGNVVREAGFPIDWESLEREIFGERESGRDMERAREIARLADRIASLILHSDMPRVDIEIEIRSFRRRVLADFPEKRKLFEALYVGRFRRLWSQFREGEDPLFGPDS